MIQVGDIVQIVKWKNHINGGRLVLEGKALVVAITKTFPDGCYANVRFRSGKDINVVNRYVNNDVQNYGVRAANYSFKTKLRDLRNSL